MFPLDLSRFRLAVGTQREAATTPPQELHYRYTTGKKIMPFSLADSRHWHRTRAASAQERCCTLSDRSGSNGGCGTSDPPSLLVALRDSPWRDLRHHPAAITSRVNGRAAAWSVGRENICHRDAPPIVVVPRAGPVPAHRRENPPAGSLPPWAWARRS